MISSTETVAHEILPSSFIVAEKNETIETTLNRWNHAEWMNSTTWISCNHFKWANEYRVLSLFSLSFFLSSLLNHFAFWWTTVFVHSLYIRWFDSFSISLFHEQYKNTQIARKCIHKLSTSNWSNWNYRIWISLFCHFIVADVWFAKAKSYYSSTNHIV